MTPNTGKNFALTPRAQEILRAATKDCDENSTIEIERALFAVLNASLDYSIADKLVAAANLFIATYIAVEHWAAQTQDSQSYVDERGKLTLEG
jgi:hypothetical protein